VLFDLARGADGGPDSVLAYRVNLTGRRLAFQSQKKCFGFNFGFSAIIAAPISNHAVRHVLLRDSVKTKWCASN